MTNNEYPQMPVIPLEEYKIFYLDDRYSLRIIIIELKIKSSLFLFDF